MASNEMSDREVFENTFHYFIAALRVLSSDAATQCKDMDNYNTPYEIQSDTTARGIGALRLSAHYLNWEQAEKIVDLVAALRRLPPEALSVPHLRMTGHIGCITAMNHPAWVPLREEAVRLLVLLRPEIERNTLYFQQQ
jgi:hypothetical protein